MPPNPESFDDFNRAIAEVEATLCDLKQRYAQVQHDRQQRDELRARQAALSAAESPPADELAAIAQQLETIELNLESRLFRWGALQEPFWQAVRFGGLGLLLGWLLGLGASWLERPQPETAPSQGAGDRPARVVAAVPPRCPD